jgi:amidase
MSISLDGLSILFRSILSTRPWLRDPLCVRMPWSQDQYNLEDHGGTLPAQEGGGPAAVAAASAPKLCFGIMWNDGRVRPTPAVRRALEMTKRALEEAGHELGIWVMEDVREMGRLLVGSPLPSLGVRLYWKLSRRMESAETVGAGWRCAAVLNDYKRIKSQ